jgi:hypothetical protein
MTAVPDLAQIRLDNAMRLFDEFVHQAARHPDAATLRGLEGRFAERLQIQPSYWSQIKGRSRQIGERLARQFERCMHKPMGWMDQPHTAAAGRSAAPRAAGAALRERAVPAPAATEPNGPHTDDERFIVGLVLSYYRRHPERARVRLLELLGEVLTPAPAASPLSSSASPSTSTSPPALADDRDVWRRVAQGVAPLKKKR